MYSYTITCKATLILAMAYIIILCRPIWSIYGLSRWGIKLTFYHSTRCNSRTTVITKVEHDFFGENCYTFFRGRNNVVSAIFVLWKNYVAGNIRNIIKSIDNCPQ